jgi:uncharacterized MAPEG superfamily protein
MTTELTWLMLTAILAASIWIPYIVGINLSNFEGKDEVFERPPDLAKMPAWVHRSHRAQANLIEQFVPFAVIVLITRPQGLESRHSVVRDLVLLAACRSRYRHDQWQSAATCPPYDLPRRMDRYTCDGVAGMGICPVASICGACTPGQVPGRIPLLVRATKATQSQRLRSLRQADD